jgi:hypothetical protein
MSFDWSQQQLAVQMQVDSARKLSFTLRMPDQGFMNVDRLFAFTRRA